MKTKYLLIISLLLYFNGVALAQDKPNPLRVLIKQAIEVNPKIRMLQSKMSVAKEKIQVGTHLPDPVANLGLVNIPTNTFSFNQEAMTAKVLGLSQSFPFPGYLKAKANVKAVDTLIVQQEIADLKNQIINQVSELYYNLQEKRREIVLAKESISLLKQISIVAKRKFEVGTASLQNIIQVEVQLTRVNDDIETLQGEEVSTIAQINAFLLRNEYIPIITTIIAPIKKETVSSDSLLKLANQYRPLLQEIKLYQHKALLQQKEAKYAFYPNFRVGVQYSNRAYNSHTGFNYPSFLGVVAGITIPINYGGKKTARVNATIYLQDVYRQQLNSSLQILQQSFGNINAQLKALQSRENLVEKTLLPQAIQSYQAAIADYQVNKIDFVNVIQAEDDIIRIKTELAKIRTTYYKKMSRLEFLSGAQFL